jgi:hypothetical protein
MTRDDDDDDDDDADADAAAAAADDDDDDASIERCEMHALENVIFLCNAVGKSYWTPCPLNMKQLGCPETSTTNCQSTLRNIPEEQSSHLHGGESLKIRVLRKF